MSAWVKRTAVQVVAYLPIGLLLALFFDPTLGQIFAISVAIGVYGGAYAWTEKRWTA